MSFDRQLFASKLRRCREQLSWSRQEVQRVSGVQDERVMALEAGESMPTGDEVLLLAHAFRKDYRFFVSEERLDPLDETEELFRAQGAALSAADRRAIHEFLFLCESEARIGQLLERRDSALPSVELSIPANYDSRLANADGRRAAGVLRSAMGLGPREVPSDVFAALRRLGLHVFRRKLQNSDVSGLYIQHPVAGGCLLVNYSEDEYRQRFTAMHEAGHAIMDAGAKYVISKTSDRAQLRERRANAFAGAVLVPPGTVEQLRGRRVWTREDAARFATKLQVSVLTLCIELQAAGVLTWEQSKHLSDGNTLSRSDKPDPELGSLGGRERERKEDLLRRGLSGHYVRLCFEAYLCGKVSRGRLCEIMLSSPVELQEIASSFGVLWNYDDHN